MSMEKGPLTVEPQKEIIERKMAGEDINYNLSLLNAALESTADGILVVDREGKIAKFNRKFVQMWAIPESILTSRNDDQALAFVLDQLKYPQSFFARVKEIYADPEAESFDQVEFKDGRIFERYSQPQRLGDEIVGRVWSFRDVTKRIRIEQTLIKSEEEAKGLSRENEILAEIGRIISSTLNIEEIYERFAEEVKKLIPFDRIVIDAIDIEKNTLTNLYIEGEKIPGRKIGETYSLQGSGVAEMVRTNSTLLIQAEDFQEYKDRFPMLLTTFQAGFRSIMNVPLCSKGKIMGGLLLRSFKPYAFTENEVRLAERVGDQIAGAIANAQLFAEQKRTEKALRESEDRYRDLVEYSEYLITTHDLEGNILSVNQRAANLLGYEQSDIINRNIRDLLAPEVKHESDQYLDTILKEKKARGVMLIQTASGEKRVWEYNNSLRMEGATARIVRSMAHDITDLKRIENEREKLIKDLRKALSEVKQLSGLLPICASCKKIRDDKGYWNQIETYIRDRSDAEFSHGICPDCFKKLYPDMKM